MKARTGVFDIEMYGARVHWVFAENLTIAGKLFAKEHEADEYTMQFFDASRGEPNGRSWRTGGSYLVYLKTDILEDRGFAFLCSVLSHEALHTAFEIGRFIGSVHCSESEEFYTYLQDHILENLLKAYLPQIRNRKDLKKLLR